MLGDRALRNLRTGGCTIDATNCFLDFSDPPIMNHCDGADETIIATLLSPYLDNTFSLADHIAYLLSFFNRQRHGFLAIDVFSGKHSFDCDFRMPVIWG